MRKSIFVTILVLSLLVSGCGVSNKYESTKSIITEKEIQNGNQYYFYVSYKIEGTEGEYTATIKISNKTTYDKYEVGDEYVFKRPVAK